MTNIPQGHLYLGGVLDTSNGERTDEAVHLEASDLTTHGVIVGMTGSGKTGLSVIMLEEALLQGCLLYTSPSPRDKRQSRMPSSA